MALNWYARPLIDNRKSLRTVGWKSVLGSRGNMELNTASDPRAFMVAKRLLVGTIKISKTAVADHNLDLKTLLN